MPRTRLPIAFRVGQRRVDGETLYVEAGADVLVLTSCSAELGLTLRGAYLDDGGAGQVLVAESAALGSGPADLRSRRIGDAKDALAHERRRLLYDHLQALQDLAAQGGIGLAFDGVEQVAAKLDPHSPLAATR